MIRQLLPNSAKILLVAAAFSIGSFGAALQLYRFRGQADASALLRRQAEVQALRAETFGRADALIVGDSILGSVNVDCGRTLAVTVPAARSAEILPSAAKAARLVQPRVVVIGVGTNDQRDFGRVAKLAAFANWPGTVIWVLPPQAPATVRAMRQLAARRHEATYRFGGGTLDGVHPDAAGRARFAREVSRLCRAELKGQRASPPQPG
jgi:lysophospholipase L1-like esterase